MAAMLPSHGVCSGGTGHYSRTATQGRDQRSTPGLGAWLCPRHVGAGKLSAEGRTRAHANSSDDPDVHTTRSGEKGRQGPILLTPVSPNLAPLGNPCPVNQVFTGGRSVLARTGQSESRRSPCNQNLSDLGTSRPGFHLLKVGESQPQDHPLLPSGPRLQTPDILLPFNKNNPNLPLWTTSPQTQTEASTSNVIVSGGGGS